MFGPWPGGTFNEPWGSLLSGRGGAIIVQPDSPMNVVWLKSGVCSERPVGVSGNPLLKSLPGTRRWRDRDGGVTVLVGAGVPPVVTVVALVSWLFVPFV